MRSRLRLAGALAGGTLAVAAATAAARGVTPYLPLSLEPEMERAIERVLIFADKPVLTRPIPAVTVRDALPAACAADRALCERVARYLARFMPPSAITHLSIEGSADGGDAIVLPNRHGLRSDSAWAASAKLQWQPWDYVLVSTGGVAYDGEATPTGTLLSVGFDAAQLDVGWRDHQFSPFTDGAMLIGTQAPTMPSITLSNYRPLTRLGLRYEAFLAEMSESSRIALGNGFTQGSPLLAGTHVSIEPVPGWMLGANRLIQFGGGERGGRSLSDFWRAFFDPSRFDNASSNLTLDQSFGNQLGSFTSRFVYPGRTPFTVYFEYAGEDTSRGRNYLLGNSSLSIGLDFPRLPFGLDATLELAEWQNGWYVNGIYGDGLTNEGRGIGHWLVDRRRPGDAVGGRSQMLRVGWQPAFGGDVEFRWRSLDNERYTGFAYDRSQEFTLAYSRIVSQFRIGAALQTGSDVFGEDFSRVAAFFRWVGPQQSGLGWLADELQSSGAAEESGARLFVALGATTGRTRADLDLGAAREWQSTSGAHLALGVRRPVTARSDLGARIEFDEIDGRGLLGVRALDYRYRLSSRVALTGFLGAARYDLATPAFGQYGGIGAEWMEVLPGWSLGAEAKLALKVARDRVLPGEAIALRREDAFYDIAGVTLTLRREF